MTPVEALLDARRHGVQVSADRERLVVSANHPVPMEVVRVLREHKAALLEMLTLAEASNLCYFGCGRPVTGTYRDTVCATCTAERGLLGGTA